MIIALEVGDIGRFAGVGEFVSYCRCVDSQRLSNGKRKGEANRKCGNRYLAWAFMEAAHFAIRVLPAAKRFYERKRRQRHPLLAVKALAHKLARACSTFCAIRCPSHLSACSCSDSSASLGRSES